MSGVMISRKELIKANISRLLELVDKQPRTNSKVDNIGYIFLIDKKQSNILKKLPKGKRRVLYINSPSFISNIEAFYSIIYNVRKKICEIRYDIDSIKNLERVLQAILVYLPRDVILWTGIISPEYYENYILIGFNNPYITKISPLGYRFNQEGIAFMKLNMPSESISKTTVRNKLKYATDQKFGYHCKIYAKFTPKALKFLKKINSSVVMVENKKLKEKELAGSLRVSEVNNINGKIVFELSPDSKSIKSGAEEEVDAVWSRYNFHTHPKKAYINHNVKNGWPSSQDYVGFVQLKNHTIFHTVVTLEGIYIISFSPEWDGDPNKINQRRILNDYDIDHKEDITFEKYTEIINNKKYNGKQLFIVKYMPWNRASQIFPIFYAKTNGSCLATDQNFNIVQK